MSVLNLFFFSGCYESLQTFLKESLLFLGSNEYCDAGTI